MRIEMKGCFLLFLVCPITVKKSAKNYQNIFDFIQKSFPGTIFSVFSHNQKAYIPYIS